MRIAPLALLLLASTSCRSSHRGNAEPSPAPAAPVDALDTSARRCMPAMVCDSWKGCALVVQRAAGWTVEDADQVPRGLLAVVGQVCTRGRCDGARVVPPGVTCPPWSEPPLIDPPPYDCVLEQGSCRAHSR